MGRARHTIPLILCAAALVTLALLLTRYAVAALRPQPVAAPARAVAQTDVNPYGANFFLNEEVEEWKRERTVRMAQQAGIGWAKQEFLWSDVEPNAKGEFTAPGTREDSWNKYDEIVDLYLRYGMQVIARLDRAPDWARPAGSPKEQPPKSLKDYGDFVYAFVEHFKGRVSYIQIWNEPNIFPEWGDQPVDPVAYAAMLKEAYTRAKEADPNVQVLCAPLAITTEEFPERRNLSDLVFLEELYQAGAGAYFDILSANAFGMDQAPAAAARADTLNFARVLLQREIMERYGDAGKAVWFNEYGWNASPATFSDEQLTWKRVSEELQASYTVQGIELARRDWPWAGVFNIWYFRQVGHIQPADPAYYFRIVDVDFTPRPVYYAVQKAATALKVAAPGVIGEQHPAVTWNYGWQSAGDERASGQRYAVTATPGANMTLRFRGEGIAVIARGGPTEGRLNVWLDGARVSGLPVDEAGNSYIDLGYPERTWGRRIPLAAGLASGEHTLELTMADYKAGGSATTTTTVDGFDILAKAAAPFPTAAVVLLGIAGIGCGVWAVVLRRRRGLRVASLRG